MSDSSSRQPRSRSSSFDHPEMAGDQGRRRGSQLAAGSPLPSGSDGMQNEREMLCRMIFSLPSDEEYLEVREHLRRHGYS